MTTNTALSTMADKWLPFPVEALFTMQRAPDMWFGDELPPTVQDLMVSPRVTQAKAMITYQLLGTLAQGEKRRMVIAEQRDQRRKVGRVGKREKTSRRH